MNRKPELRYLQKNGMGEPDVTVYGITVALHNYGRKMGGGCIISVNKTSPSSRGEEMNGIDCFISAIRWSNHACMPKID